MHLERPPPPHWLDSPRNVTLLVLLQGAVFFGIGIAVWYASGRAPSDFLRWEAKDLIVGAALGAALVGSMQAIASAFPRFVPWAAEQQRRLFPGGRRYRPADILLISAAAGIGEEALFRGGLQTFMADHLPPSIAICMASLLFVLMHLGSPGVSAFIFVYSLAFGLAYHQTGSLVGVMLAHAAFDIWALALVQRELSRRGMLKA
ncbi:MAG: CPBP family intramembrane metalloprotease [Pseudomonadota bacterium]|nr:CPBP family intramembrane metalloprotease [Pseudomonadota bacterium]